MESPAYAKERVNWAGDVLKDSKSASGDRAEATRVWDNWRASHELPLVELEAAAKSKARQISDQALVYGRLKRLPSVIDKLTRPDTQKMRMARMQDIGGCRAVLPTIEDVLAVRELFRAPDLRHELAREDDYLARPRKSGYRGIHLIHKFSPPPDSHAGLAVETQIRSRLQHAWATAVECIDIIYSQRLKFGGGAVDWTRFFLLMSAAMAIREGTPCPADTPSNLEGVVAELRPLAKALEAERRLTEYKNLIQSASERVEGAKWLLLELRTGEKLLEIKGFREEEREEANRQYTAIDKDRLVTGREAVLVSVESLVDLPKAYPNYYLDTEHFVKIFRETLG
ncbi:MAG: RelA/SpoT domain-containing protein [Candidatus Thermoplasmatota archaeon]